MKIEEKMNRTVKEMFHRFLTGENLLEEETLAGTSIIVTVTEAPPFLSIVRRADGTIKTLKGYLAELWSIIQENLKFRTILREPEDGNFGDNKNGTWDGVIADLEAGRADVGLVNLGITPERKSVVDFLTAVDHDSSKLLAYSSANLESVDWMTFVTTLSWKIWIFVGALWIMASLSLALISHIRFEKTRFGYIFFLFGAITMQGSEMVPKGFPGRLIFIIFWTMCVVTHASFTAVLTTHLTTASYQPLNSLKEALDKGFKISVVRGTQQHQKVLGGAATNAEFKMVAEMLETDESLLLSTLDEGVPSTYDGKTLFLYDSKFLQYMTATNCSLTIQPPEFFTGYLHIPVRRHLPYINTLNEKITRLQSSGILNKLELKWVLPKQECYVIKEETPSLGLTKTLFAFAIVSGGVLASLIILLSEMGIKKWFSRSHKHLRRNAGKKTIQRKELEEKIPEKFHELSIFLKG